MLNQHPIFSGKHLNRRRSGLTLIELLVVITILGLIMIMAIPRLRMINEDRNIREAARTVGSVFAKASQLAFTDGAAGVCIELNPNIYDVDNVRYAGTALYMLQKLPPYFGDDAGAAAHRIPPPVLPNPPDPDYFRKLDILMPYSFMNLNNPADERNMVRINDLIRINVNNVKYRVENLERVMRDDLDPMPTEYLRITLVDEFKFRPPLPASNAAGYPFVVYRQPKIQQSSRVQLPEGYLIDLRYSGELSAVDPSTAAPPQPRIDLPVSGSLPFRSVFHDSSPLPATRPNPNFETKILFAEDGFIDHYEIPSTPTLPPFHRRIFFRPTGDLYFFITRFETNKDREQVNSPLKTSAEPDPLSSQTNMWLKVDVRTGASTISYNVPPPNTYTTTPPTPPELFLPRRILDARSIATTSQAAND